MMMMITVAGAQTQLYMATVVDNDNKKTNGERVSVRQSVTPCKRGAI